MRVIYYRKKARCNIIQSEVADTIRNKVHDFEIFSYIIRFFYSKQILNLKVYIVRSICSVVFRVLILHTTNVIENHGVKNNLMEVLRIMMVSVIIQDLENK